LPDRILLSQLDFNKMLVHVDQCYPEEACGILAGSKERVSRVIPVENELHSQVEFRMKPVELLNALLWIEDQGLEMIAYYHSHPDGPSFPSQTDIRQFMYPGAAVLIIIKSLSHWGINGFMIEGEFFKTIPVVQDQET
jgi:proteasome lid subunit RPN8/RPN11